MYLRTTGYKVILKNIHEVYKFPPLDGPNDHPRKHFLRPAMLYVFNYLAWFKLRGPWLIIQTLGIDFWLDFPLVCVCCLASKLSVPHNSRHTLYTLHPDSGNGPIGPKLELGFRPFVIGDGK